MSFNVISTKGCLLLIGITHFSFNDLQQLVPLRDYRISQWASRCCCAEIVFFQTPEELMCKQTCVYDPRLQRRGINANDRLWQTSYVRTCYLIYAQGMPPLLLCLFFIIFYSLSIEELYVMTFEIVVKFELNS